MVKVKYQGFPDAKLRVSGMEDGDIATAEFSYEKLDHVIHLASRTYVPASWENPLDFYRTNASGTTNILDLCRKQGCSLTYVSSYVYGTPQYLPVDENHPVAPVSPYNHSKLVAEDICRFYSEQFGVPVTILRPVNIFGPGQNPSFLIPFIIEQVDSLKELGVDIDYFLIQGKGIFGYLKNYFKYRAKINHFRPDIVHGLVC